jgi:hypothetical protein
MDVWKLVRYPGDEKGENTRMKEIKKNTNKMLSRRISTTDL